MASIPRSILSASRYLPISVTQVYPIPGPSRPVTHKPFHTSFRQLAVRPPPPARPSPSRGAPKSEAPLVNLLSLRDRHIPFRSVRFVSPTDNSLSPLTPLSTILSSYDHSTHTLILVSADPPICKLLNKEDERQKARVAEVKAKMNRKVAVEEKEVQVSWASASGDLRHKAGLAKGILERGDRATVIFAAKSGAEKVGAEQQREITGIFEKELEEVGVRWKEDEKNKGAWIVFWGPVASVREGRRAKVQEEEVGRRKEKNEKKEARRKKEEERHARAAKKSMGEQGASQVR